MEISLDNMQVSFMTAGIKTASDSVSLTAAETEIKSRSEAFISAFFVIINGIFKMFTYFIIYNNARVYIFTAFSGFGSSF